MLAAAFIQNSLQRVRVGDDAEVSFRAVPGKIFKARVAEVIDVMAQGQLQPSGALIDSAIARTNIARSGPWPASSCSRTPISINCPAALSLRSRSTHYWHHVALLRKVLLRMSSWMNYVFLEH